jgi:hypothetical protein
MTMGRRRGCPNNARLCQASPEHFQQCAEFPLLRNRGLGPLAVTVLPIPIADSGLQVEADFCEIYARARASWGLIFRHRNVCAQTWILFNDDYCTLPKNWTRMSRSNLPRNALVPAND